MKNAAYILIGILLVLVIYSIWKLNQVSTKINNATKFIEPNTSTETSSSTGTPAQSVTAGDFVNRLTNSLKDKVDSVTLNFTK